MKTAEVTTKRAVAKDMAKQGIPVQAICESMNVPRATYYRWREADLDWPDRSVTPLPSALRNEVLEALTGGESVSSISRRLGVARKTIARWRRLRPAARWRCYCTPFGVPVAGLTCPHCNESAPSAVQEAKQA